MPHGSYRKITTSLFPTYWKLMAKLHEDDVRSLLKDAFNIKGNIDDSINELIQLFSHFGIDANFHENFSEEKIRQYPNM